MKHITVIIASLFILLQGAAADAQATDEFIVFCSDRDGDYDIFFESLGALTGITYDNLDRLSEKLP